jgi:transposase, IS5 family
MIVDRYEPVNLFALIPARYASFEPQLQELDHLLDDDAIFQRVKQDLAHRYPQSLTRGRHSTPVEVILRMLVVKRLYRWSYEDTERFVFDSLLLRQFCRVYWEDVPDDTTLNRWANLLTPATLEAIHERVVQLARERKVTRGRKLRVDSAVVETTIHHPTDSSLLADGVRVLSRLVRRAKAVLGPGTELGRAAFRTRMRSVRRLTQELHRVARRKGEEAAEDLTETYRRLIEVAKQSCAQARRVAAALKEQTEGGATRLAQELDELLPSVDQVIYQTERRVIHDEKLSAAEKLVSLFEPHTQIIKRQKAGKATEFGRKLWLEEVEGGIVSGYRVLEEAGQDDRYLAQSLADHQQRFGHPPWLLAGDRGVSSPKNEQLAKEAGVKRVVLPAKGKVSEKRKQQERERWFRRGFRFRAGIEGRISVLRRCYELDRCRDHGDEGMGRWVGWGIITANLVTIARTETSRHRTPPVSAA